MALSAIFSCACVQRGDRWLIKKNRLLTFHNELVTYMHWQDGFRYCTIISFVYFLVKRPIHRLSILRLSAIWYNLLTFLIFSVSIAKLCNYNYWGYLIKHKQYFFTYFPWGKLENMKKKNLKIIIANILFNEKTFNEITYNFRENFIKTREIVCENKEKHIQCRNRYTFLVYISS